MSSRRSGQGIFGAWHRWCLGLLACLPLIAPPAALAETVVIRGRPLELAPPTGFCRPDPQVLREAALAQSLSRDEPTGRRTVLSFVDCQSLEAWRTGGPARFARIGWLADLDPGGDPQRPRETLDFLAEMREALPHRAAGDIVTDVAGPALLIETPRYFIVASRQAGSPPRLRIELLTQVNGLALQWVLVEDLAGSPAGDALLLTEAAGELAQALGEVFAVNDIFDDADVLSEAQPSGTIQIIALMAAVLAFSSFIGIRAMWLLLRAPRRRGWPLEPPGL